MGQKESQKTRKEMEEMAKSASSDVEKVKRRRAPEAFGDRQVPLA